MKKQFLFVLSLLLLTSFDCPKPLSAKVVGVADGDTISVLLDGIETRIRLAAIDAPEKSQDFGQVAKDYTSKLCFGKNVSLEITDTDRYGRKIAFITLSDGRSLNRLLVEAGLAWHYTRYSNDSTLDDAEASARNKKIGLWSKSNPTPPWDYRKSKLSN